MAISIEQWRERGQVSTLLGHRIFHVDTRGRDEPAILLIHGFPTSSWDWTHIWEALAGSHRLIALDLLGFGFSAKPRPHRYSIMEQADLCEALVDHLGLERFHVLSHDYGDTVAQELLARQNERRGRGRWISLCLLNGGLFPETHRARRSQKWLLGPLGPILSRLGSARMLKRSLAAIFGPETQPSAETLDGFWRLIEREGGARILHLLMTYITEREQHRERWVGALREAQIPIALINGSADPVSGAHMVARYREVVGEEHPIVELPRIGHYPQVEAPHEVVEAYRDFFG